MQHPARLAERLPSASRAAPMGRHATRRILLLALIAGAAACSGPATAQTPPTDAEARALAGLHAAAWRGDLARIRTLLQSGADADARDAQGRTPLHLATHARQRAAVRLLLQKGAQPGLLDAERYDAVTIAAVADDTGTLADLLAGGARADLVTSRYDGTALIAAAHLGHDGVVRQLIAAGAPLDHVNNLHWTAAIEAVVLGDGGPRHQHTLAALVEAGADLRLADRQGRTPLQLAQARGYTGMVALLSEPRRP